MSSKAILFFDLDDTLYPPNNGLWTIISQRMNDYIERKFSLSQQEASQLRDSLYHTYGTTLRGLQNLYQIDEDEYLDYVHDVPLEPYIQPNPALRQMLQYYPQPKMIFTNAHTPHAQRVLNRLGISDQFDQICDIRTIAPYCKPMPEAFAILLKTTGADPTQSVMIDDMPKTIQTARSLGFTGILVGRSMPANVEDLHIAAITDLPNILPPI